MRILLILLSCFKGLNYVFSGLMESIGASRKVLEYIHRTPKINYDGKERRPIKGHLEIDGVSFAYPSRASTNVLSDFSIQISPGR